MYILLKYRAVLVRKYLDGWILNFVPREGDSAVNLKVIDLLSDILSFVLEELKQQAVAHRIRWDRPSLQVVQPAYSFAPRQPTAFALRVSQFCTMFIDYSLFRGFITEDSYKFCCVCCFCKNRFEKCPDCTEYSLSCSDSAPIPDVTKALNQLRASIDQFSERDDGAKHKDTLLLHLHHLERNLTARIGAQDRVLGALRIDSNDQRNLMSMDIKSSHKQLSTQIASNALDVVDVRRVVRENHQELTAKVTSLEEQVAATRHDLLDFSAQSHQTLNVITD
ncbi:TRP protein for flagellar function [Dorcoceras hygrometricum]|uniref:TRP protein for flagellar function n=1 Tax=Dorcoceras hygrometricum TaxID=472368 RepID=A0A2Z7A6E6_9LAMI|nr:TRP protein for flagellar function [Dorcoceras hygrometricum]